MIQHVVLLKWNDEVSAEQVAQVTSAFRALGEHIDELVSYEFGPDAGIYRGNADYALVARFRNEADLKAYVVHPRHQALLAQVTSPILKSFQAVQFGSSE